MAKIPESAFRTRLSLDVPRTPTRSIQSAGIVAQAQAQVGVEAASLVEGIADRRAKSEMDDYTNSETADLAIKLGDISAENKRKFSGKELIEESKAAFDTLIEEASERAPTSRAARKFQNSARAMANNTLLSLNAFQHKQRAKLSRDNELKNIDKFSLSQFQSPNPGQAIQHLNTYLLGLKAKEGNDFSPEETKLLEAKARNNIAMGTVYGYMEMGKFEAAEALVDSNFLQAFDTESAAKMNKKIRTEFTLASNRKLKNERDQEKLQEKQFKAQEEGHLQDLISRMNQGEDVRKEAQDLMATGQIGIDRVSFVRRNVMNPTQTKIDDDLSFQFKLRLAQGEGTASILSEVQKSVKDGQLSTDTAESLINSLNTRRGARLDFFKKRSLNRADKLIKEMFPAKDPISRLPNEENREMFMSISGKLDDLVARGADPFEAAQALIQANYSEQVKNDFKQFDSKLLEDPVGNDKAIKGEMIKLLDQKKMNKAQFADFLNKLDQLQKLSTMKNFRPLKEIEQELGNAN